MINVIVHIDADKETQSSIKQQIESAVSNIDLYPFGVEQYTIYAESNIDRESLSEALQIAANSRIYLLFQNRPKYLEKNTSFDAELARFGIRLRSLDTSYLTGIENILIVVDFSKEPLNNTVETSLTSSKDRKGMFVPTNPKYSMKQVVISEEMKKDIYDAISIIKNQEVIYKDWGFEEIDSEVRTIINFHGPAGTGKTKCAHAIADELGKKILCLNYSDIESMWAGESPKNLVAAFRAAEDVDALLFMDEADSFLGKRITNVQSGHDQSINSLRSQLLILLENFHGIVIFATNLVKNFDKAFETRIVKHIKFDLPDAPTCARLYKILIPSKLPLQTQFNDEDYNKLGELSEGLSGRDIRNIILETMSFAANNHISTFKREMFEETIRNKKMEYEKLQEQDIVHEHEIGDAVIDSLILETAKRKQKALKTICTVMINELELNDEEKERCINELSFLWGLDMTQKEEITIEEACATFESPINKLIVIGLLQVIFSIVDNIPHSAWKLIQKIYCLLGYDIENFTKFKEFIKNIK